MPSRIYEIYVWHVCYMPIHFGSEPAHTLGGITSCHSLGTLVPVPPYKYLITSPMRASFQRSSPSTNLDGKKSAGPMVSMPGTWVGGKGKTWVDCLHETPPKSKQTGNSYPYINLSKAQVVKWPVVFKSLWKKCLEAAYPKKMHVCQYQFTSGALHVTGDRSFWKYFMAWTKRTPKPTGYSLRSGDQIHWNKPYPKNKLTHAVTKSWNLKCQLSLALRGFEPLIALVSLATCLVIVNICKCPPFLKIPGKLWRRLELANSLTITPQIRSFGCLRSPSSHPERLSPYLGRMENRYPGVWTWTHPLLETSSYFMHNIHT